METKILNLHSDKSCFLVFGTQKQKQKIQEELAVTPIKLYGKDMKQKQKEKYLGDFLHVNGNGASVTATVNDRAGRIVTGMYDIRHVIENCRSNQLGSLKAGIHMWETAYIPSLLNNCKTWVELPVATLNKLEDLQNQFYRIILNCPRSTPKPALIWELGGRKIKWRIIQEKLVFMNHILQLDPSSLAKQVQEIQEKENLPGLTQECKEYIVMLELPNLFEENISKAGWKTMVKSAIRKENEREVLEAMNGYKKLKERPIVRESLGMKDYVEKLSLYEARIIFKHKSSMSRYVKMNYKGDKKYKQEGWKCDDCLQLDTEDHLLSCIGYEELRKNLNLEINKDLAAYLHKIYMK